MINMIDEYSSVWWVEYLDKQPYTCSVCKFADEYAAYWWFPYFDPSCSKGHSCYPDKDACRDFKMCGRLCR